MASHNTVSDADSETFFIIFWSENADWGCLQTLFAEDATGPSERTHWNEKEELDRRQGGKRTLKCGQWWILQAQLRQLKKGLDGKGIGVKSSVVPNGLVR